jgi:hypothetical protein
MLRPPRQAFVGDMPTPARGTSPGRLASTPNAVVAGEFLSHRRRRPLEFAAGLTSSMARPHPELLTMPLDFSDEEMTLLLALAQPIEPAQRSAFLDAVAAAIGSRRAGRASFSRPRGGSRGISGRRRRFRPTRRRPCTAATPPEGLGGRLKGEVPSWNTMGEAAIIGGRACWLFSYGPALDRQRKHRRAWPG